MSMTTAAVYENMVLLAIVTIYIVDISGFTQSWRDALARWLKVSSVRPLPPFDCGKCMTFWVTLIYSIVCGQFTLWTLALSALMSFLAVPVGQLLILVREWVIWVTNKLMP